jgi:hypothetical protein
MTEEKLEDVIQTFKDIVYKYCDENLIHIVTDDYHTGYLIRVDEQTTNFTCFTLTLEYKYNNKYNSENYKILNFKDLDFDEYIKDTNFRYIEDYIKHYYSYNNLENDILMFKNFNSELYNKLITKYIERTNDVKIFKDPVFIKRLTSELKIKYDYLINATKFDLI